MVKCLPVWELLQYFKSALEKWYVTIKQSNDSWLKTYIPYCVGIRLTKKKTNRRMEVEEYRPVFI